MNKITITINFNWNAIMPQIAECLNDIVAFGYTPQEIDEVLADPHNWTEHPIFRRQEFHYEHARFTLTDLCNMVELLTGSDTTFANELRNRVKGLLVEEVAA